MSPCVVLSRVRLSATPRTAARQAPLSMGFSRQEHWNGLPCPPPGDLPYPGTEPRCPALQVDSLPSEPPGKPSCPFISSEGGHCHEGISGLNRGLSISQ